jgi:tRNA(Glu) U13 pseudouridine synthase TruD
LPGERRPLRVPLLDPEIAVAARDGAIRLEFDLPAGAFATAVLSEVRKQDPAPM